MLDENRDKLIDLVGEAAQLPPSERRAFIRAAAAKPAEQEEALSLLDALEQAGDFMDRPSGAHPALPAGCAGDTAGGAVGRYRLLNLIGEGGFGHVFLAEQQEPVVRRVALKIVRPGMDSQGVISRFEAERQALAMMDHPAIAKVFDGGATESGRPYFVMELVDGLPITAYCDRARMTVADRLNLFREVCDAVQHAHQKGVIHRDLKPANVLVADHDGRARPKVIDFGIAKAITHAPADSTTRLQEFIGTPEYMSPEQTLGPGADIDTRSDIYSLGVILYELLTGATPLDAGTLRSAGPAEMQRLIRDTVAPRPSTRLIGTPADDVAAQRQTDPQRLRLRLREDLDWIVLRALEKDRDRRYPTAAALADDIRRSLDHEPVTASPPSALYRLRKFVRRNRTATIAGSLVAASLLLGTVAASVGLISSIAQRHRAEEVKAFMTSMLEAATPTVARGEDTTLVRRVLDRAAARLNAGEVPDPLIDAELRQTIGSTYDQIGEEPAAEAMLKRAIELRTAALGPEHPLTLDSTATLGNIYRHMGRRPEAEAILRKAHAGLQRRLGNKNRDTLETLNDLGVALEGLGRYPEAQKCFADALAGLTTIAGRDDPLTINAEYNLGFVLLSTGKYADAEPYLTRVLAVRRRTLGDDDPLTLATMSATAGLKLELERMDEAEALLQAAVPISRRIFGDDSSHTVAVISSMGRLLVETGRADAGEALLREAFERSRQRAGPDHPDTLMAQSNMVIPLRALGRTEEAEAMLRESLEGMRRSKALGPMHPRTLYKTAAFAALLRDLGKLEEAEAEARRAYDGLKQVLAPDHPSTLAAIHTLGAVLRSRGHPEQAESLLREAMIGRTSVLGPTHTRTLLSITEHAGSLADLGRFTEAERELLASIPAAATSGGTTPPPASLCKALATLYEAWDKAEPNTGHDTQAAEWRAKAAEH